MSTATIARAATAAPHARVPRWHSFALKLAAAAALVMVGDWLFFAGGAGATLALYALLLLAALVATRPAVLRSRAARFAAGAALLFAAALADDPSLLAVCLFWVAATLAALLPRARFDNGWRWALRFLFHGAEAILRPVRDWGKVLEARRRTGPLAILARLPVLVLPLVGSLVFVLLFASANPLIGDAFGRINTSALLAGFSAPRVGFWLLLAFAAWSLLRPTLLRLRPVSSDEPAIRLPGVSLASVTLSLVAFNAIFAVQNGLDLTFLWSGAPLPEGVTLAEYAHRGAYPLIATALLAALFVLVTLRPGSDMAASGAVRRLVYLWIAQNVLLVASTMLRTLDYIEAYSLTRLRISALAWMALVAVGLLLICYRIWRRRSDRWLINANFAAAAALLAACAFVDLGAVAAQWNVRHTRDVGGPGAALDVTYLDGLGASALLPLIELEGRRLAPALREHVQRSRAMQMARLEAQQADWRSWTFRGARRLAEAKRLGATQTLPRSVPARPDPPRFVPAAPLTAPRAE
jgi:hypothetical protein